MFKIHTGVPLPSRTAGPRTEGTETLHSLPVGGMFVWEGKTAKQAANSVYSYARKSGKKFNVRDTEDGAGVWRVS